MPTIPESSKMCSQSRCLPQACAEVDSPARTALNRESLHGHAGSKTGRFTTPNHNLAMLVRRFAWPVSSTFHV